MGDRMGSIPLTAPSETPETLRSRGFFVFYGTGFAVSLATALAERLRQYL